MRSKVLLSMVALSFVGLCTFAYGQTSGIEKSFIKAIKVYLAELRAYNQERKDNPEINMYVQMGDKQWTVGYAVWSDEYSYDIRKTNSIITPYIGVVTFHAKGYDKTGKTREECLRAPWRLSQSWPATVLFAYQQGKWVYKETKLPK